MSTSKSTNPARRKSDLADDAGSLGRRRSNRISSSKSKDEEPSLEAQPSATANGSLSDQDGSLSSLSALDDLSGSEVSSDDEGFDGQDDDSKKLASRFNPNPWNWGEIPHTKSEVDGIDTLLPLPDFSDQPPARTSNGQTVPPLWEDRGIKFRAQGRYVTNPDGTKIDQQDHLVLKLVDMRPKSKSDRTPKRQLVIFNNIHGTPKDWNDTYTIKKLNATHKDNIQAICHEFTWSQREADFIAAQFDNNEDISIRELAYRFNNRFIGDFHYAEPRQWDELHTGRTIESIRGEYLANKDLYDQGKAPEKKEIRNKRWRLANGKTEGQMKYQVGDKAKANKNNGVGGQEDKQIPVPVIKSIDDYKRHTIAELTLLAEATKPEGKAFLKGLRTKDKIVAKFKEHHQNEDTQSDDDEVNLDEDDSDSDADPYANDFITMQDLPKYKNGQPNYKKLKAADQKRLISDRNMTLSASERATSDARAQALTEFDERVRRRDEERTKKKLGSWATKSSSKKRKPTTTSGRANRKKPKLAEPEDVENEEDADDETFTPASSKRNSATSSIPSNSSRKASLRSQNSKVSAADTVNTEEEIAETGDEGSEAISEE